MEIEIEDIVSDIEASEKEIESGESFESIVEDIKQSESLKTDTSILDKELDTAMEATIKQTLVGFYDWLNVGVRAADSAYESIFSSGAEDVTDDGIKNEVFDQETLDTYEDKSDNAFQKMKKDIKRRADINPTDSQDFLIDSAKYISDAVVYTISRGALKKTKAGNKIIDKVEGLLKSKNPKVAIGAAGLLFEAENAISSAVHEDEYIAGAGAAFGVAGMGLYKAYKGVQKKVDDYLAEAKADDAVTTMEENIAKQREEEVKPYTEDEIDESMRAEQELKDFGGETGERVNTTQDVSYEVKLEQLDTDKKALDDLRSSIINKDSDLDPVDAVLMIDEVSTKYNLGLTSKLNGDMADDVAEAAVRNNELLGKAMQDPVALNELVDSTIKAIDDKAYEMKGQRGTKPTKATDSHEQVVGGASDLKNKPKSSEPKVRDVNKKYEFKNVPKDKNKALSTVKQDKDGNIKITMQEGTTAKEILDYFTKGSKSTASQKRFINAKLKEMEGIDLHKILSEMDDKTARKFMIAKQLSHTAHRSDTIAYSKASKHVKDPNTGKMKPVATKMLDPQVVNAEMRATMDALSAVGLGKKKPTKEFSKLYGGYVEPESIGKRKRPKPEDPRFSSKTEDKRNAGGNGAKPKDEEPTIYNEQLDEIKSATQAKKTLDGVSPTKKQDSVAKKLSTTGSLTNETLESRVRQGVSEDIKGAYYNNKIQINAKNKRAEIPHVLMHEVTHGVVKELGIKAGSKAEEDIANYAASNMLSRLAKSKEFRTRFGLSDNASDIYAKQASKLKSKIDDKIDLNAVDEVSVSYLRQNKFAKNILFGTNQKVKDFIKAKEKLNKTISEGISKTAESIGDFLETNGIFKMSKDGTLEVLGYETKAFKTVLNDLGLANSASIAAIKALRQKALGMQKEVDEIAKNIHKTIKASKLTDDQVLNLVKGRISTVLSKHTLADIKDANLDLIAKEHGLTVNTLTKLLDDFGQQGVGKLNNFKNLDELASHIKTKNPKLDDAKFKDDFSLLVANRNLVDADIPTELLATLKAIEDMESSLLKSNMQYGYTGFGAKHDFDLKVAKSQKEMTELHKDKDWSRVGSTNTFYRKNLDASVSDGILPTHTKRKQGTEITKNLSEEMKRLKKEKIDFSKVYKDGKLVSLRLFPSPDTAKKLGYEHDAAKLMANKYRVLAKEAIKQSITKSVDDNVKSLISNTAKAGYKKIDEEIASPYAKLMGYKKEDSVYVREDVADILVGFKESLLFKGEDRMLRSMEKSYKDLFKRFKRAVTVKSPSSIVNNYLVVPSVLKMNGVPAGRIPKLMSEAHKDYGNYVKGMETYYKLKTTVGKEEAAKFLKGFRKQNIVAEMMHTGNLQSGVDDSLINLANENDMIEYGLGKLFGFNDTKFSKILDNIELKPDTAIGKFFMNKFVMADIVGRSALYSNMRKYKGMSINNAGKITSDAFVDFSTPPPKAIRVLEEYGVPFLSWMYKMQKPLFKMIKENPTDTAAIIATYYGLQAMFSDSEDKMMNGYAGDVKIDSWFLHKSFADTNVFSMSPVVNAEFPSIQPQFNKEIKGVVAGEKNVLEVLGLNVK